jgi:hypothetical protein
MNARVKLQHVEGLKDPPVLLARLTCTSVIPICKHVAVNTIVCK